MDIVTRISQDLEKKMDNSDFEDDFPIVENTDENICALCRTRFMEPKLLPCGHTFCKQCLCRLVSSLKRKDIIMCPICRRKIKISKQGINEFMTNYFIKSTPNVLKCKVCMTEVSVLDSCPNCESDMCSVCLLTHLQSKTLERNQCFQSKYSDNELLVHVHQLEILKHATKTFFCGNLKYSYYCSHEPSRGIQKILPLPKDEAWILTNNSEKILKYNKSGQQMTEITIHQRINDICQRKNGSLLILCEDSKSVLVCENSAVTKALELVDYWPSLFLPLDGLLAIAVTTEAAQCRVLIYDDEFTQLFTFDEGELGVLDEVNSMCCKGDTRTICLADTMGGRVRMIGERHPPLSFVNTLEIPFRYRGGSFRDERYNGFKPRALCCDSNGILYVYDDASGMILLVNVSGKLIGVALTDDEDNTGDPNCITFDSDGKLWIGDKVNAKVSVFTIEKIYNDLLQEDCPGNKEDNNKSLVVAETETSLTRQQSVCDPPDDIAHIIEEADKEESKFNFNNLKKRQTRINDPTSCSPPSYLSSEKKQKENVNPSIPSFMTYNQYSNEYKIPNSDVKSDSVPPNKDYFDKTLPFMSSYDHSVQPDRKGEQTIFIPVPIGLDGIPISKQEFDRLTSSMQCYAGTQYCVGSLSSGSFGTLLSLPEELQENPKIKDFVLEKIALQTGIAKENLTRFLKPKSPKDHFYLRF